MSDYRMISQLIEIAGLDPGSIDLKAEYQRWDPRYLKEFLAATGKFDREKLSYVLQHTFQGDLMDSLVKSLSLHPFCRI